MQVGGPIDNIIIDSYKFIGREPTQEEIDELKNKYQGDTEKAMNDFYSVLKTYTNETPDLRKKVALKSYYKVPLNFAETMALSENTSLNPAEENRTTKAKGYFQIIERWHKDDIQNIYGKDFQTAMQDPSIQEDYMYKHLVPSYEKRIPDLKKLFNQGYEKGVLDEYKPFMIGGRFTDDQLKAIQHVLGPTGAANLLATGQTVDEGQKRDVQRALSKMVSLRKQYGVPTFLSNQYDFDKFGIGDILPYDILAAGEDKVEETPAPKTVPYQQAPLAPGRKKVDLISPFLPKQEPKAEEEPKPKPKPIKERYGYSWEQGQTVAPKTIEPPKPALYAITETPVTKRENLIKSEGVKKQEFVESTAALKELEERNTYENYKEKPIDFENLTPEVIQARDEIQQVVANQNKRLSSSEALLRIQFGDTVTRDIQDVLANNANYTKTINNLEEKLKGKYGNNTPAKIDFGPLAEQNNEISENIKAIGTQINGIDSQLDAIQKKLDELDNDPNITPARYNVLNANLVLEYNTLVGQKNELIEKGKTLEKDLEDVVAQQNVIINDYNKMAKAEFASDPDVQELNRTYEKYKQNWDKINNYKKSPYFDSYLDSISTLSELDPIYKNLFPDKMRGEQRSKQLAKLAQDIVTEKKTDSYLLNEALIGFYDIYNGVKSLFTDAPAVGYTSIGMNALKGATFNLVGDILASAATISDFAGAEKLGRELRAGDLFGFTVTGAGIEQDVARGAVRSDIAGNPVENYYTVKENDTQLFGIGLTPGDKIIVEDGSPILYRDKNDFKINLFTLPGKNPTLIVKDFLKGKENQIEEDLSIARTVVSALPSAVDMISLIGFNAAAIPRLSKFIASKGLRTAAGMTLNFGAQTFQQYGDLYKSYLDEGKSAQKAAKFALGQSAGVALIELLNPLEMKVASIGGDAAVSQFRKVLDTTVDLYSRGQIGLLDTINAIATGFVATTGAEISKETITELFQGAFENQVQNYASNENKSYTLNEAENTAWTTVAITTIPSFFLGAASYRTAKADIITSAIYNATKDPAKFEADTLKALKDGKMDIPDSASIFNFVGYIKEELDTYENLTDEQGAALSGLIGTRYSLENKKKNSNNEVVKKKIDEQIQEINTTIEEVAKGNKKVEVDPFVKPFYEEEGQPEADRVPTKKEFSDVVYATMPKEWQDMSKEEAWKSFQELPVQDQIKFFNTATGKKEEVTAPSPTAAGLTKEQQTELDKVNKRAERIQRTLQEDTEVQEEGDEPLLTAEQKKILETELQTLNQRRDAIQKQSTAAVPVQSGAEGRQGVGGQVQAEPEGPARKGEEAKAEVKAEAQLTKEEIDAERDKIEANRKEELNSVKNWRDKILAAKTKESLQSIVKSIANKDPYNIKETDFTIVGALQVPATFDKGKELLLKDLESIEKFFTDSEYKKIKAKYDAQIADLEKTAQATKKAAPTPTPTATEKVAQKAAEAPQKANTVQGVELTKADGTKTAPAEYRKNPNTGKWGRVNAKGGITPVSSPAQVKQLEDALASQTKAAAETKKTEPTPTKVPNVLKDVQSTTRALKGKDVPNLKVRDLDTEIEYNKGDDITSLKSAINNGLGEDSKLSKNEIEALSGLEFTIFPKQDVDKSNTDIPIIIIKKRGHSFKNIQEALDYLQSKEADSTDDLSDYFEIVDGRHRVKKAINNNLPLSAVLITEKDYEDFTKKQLFSDRNDTNDIEKILSDIGARNIEEGIEILSKEDENKDVLEKLSYLEEEKRFRDSNNANTPKSIKDRNIAEAYHKAKKDGSNPALVKAVEDLLGVAPSPTAAPTPVKEQDIANELAKANNISKTQAKTISAVINTVKKNIAKRLGISLPEYRRRTAIRVVPNLQGIIKDFPNSLSSLRGLSSELINDFTGATQELKVAFQDAFGKVDAKFIKNNGIDNNDFVLSSVLTLDNNGYFDFLGKGKKLSSMKKEAIQEELNKRLSDILDRAKNTNDFYIKEFSNTWLKEAQKRATTELEKEAYQLMIDGNEDALSQQLENIQSQQKANLLASLNYLIPSKDYSPEFKYAVVSMALKGAQAKPITIKGKLIDGKLAKRNDQTVGNHQELSSMVLPNVYAEMQRGSGSHPMELIDKHTDKSIIGRDETWELVKDRVFKKSDGGYWIKFEKSNEDSDIQALTLVSKKVQKVMSADDNPWCTGGGMATAYLPQGDFYLFLNENLDPQITVRYEGDKIAELRGTDKGQALSESQTNIAEKFLDDIPNGKDHRNQVKASKVYYKLINDIEPTTKQDLQDFLDVYDIDLETYDINKQDKFFQLKNINFDKYKSLNDKVKLYDEIVKNTDARDIAVFEDIAKKNPNSPLLKKKVLVIGDLYLRDFRGYVYPEELEIKGNLSFEDQYTSRSITLPNKLRISGKLIFNDVNLPQDFKLPKDLQIGGPLVFNNIDLPQDFKLPKDFQIGGGLYFNRVKIPQGFTLPNNLKSENGIYFSEMEIPKYFTFPQDLETKRLDIINSNIQEGFTLPNNLKLKDALSFTSSILPKDFTLPSGLEAGALYLSETNLPENFTIPKDLKVERVLSFSRSTIRKGLNLPQDFKVDRLDFTASVIEEGLSLPKGLDTSTLNFRETIFLSKSDMKKYLDLVEEKNRVVKEEGLTKYLLQGEDKVKKFKRGYVQLRVIAENIPVENTQFLNISEDSKINYLNFNTTVLPKNFNLPIGLNIDPRSIDFDSSLLESGGEAETIFERWSAEKSIAQQDSRGAIIETPTSTLMLLDKDNADVTTPIHEVAHEYEKVLTADERKVMEDWSGAKFGTTKFREAFAKGAERYLYEGATFNGKVDAVFEKLKNWFKNVITDAINYFGDINQLTPEVREIYSKMLIDGDLDVVETVAPSPTAAETQVEAEAKTAEELSADIEADIEAAEAKEQEAMAKAFKGNKKQTAANDLIKNPKSVDALPQDLLEDLYNLAAEAKYTPALKKKCD